MAIKNREQLKDQFRNRVKPDEDDFADVFDSSLNKIDDQIVVDGKNNIGIGYPQGTELDHKLDVQGNLQVKDDATIGSKLKVGDSVEIRNTLGFLHQDSTEVEQISTDPEMHGYQASHDRIVTEKAIKDYVDTRIVEGVSFGVSHFFAGSIAPFARPSVSNNPPEGHAPEGWLICDGGQYDVAEYKTLHDVIGDQYGAGDGSGNNFNVPDLRGIFIRGMDLRNSGNEDPDRHGRTDRLTGEAVDNSLGGYQDDAFRFHDHNLLSTKIMLQGNENIITAAIEFIGDMLDGPFELVDNVLQGQLEAGGDWVFLPLPENLQTNSLTGYSGGKFSMNETRPKNAIFMYCIKY